MVCSIAPPTLLLLLLLLALAAALPTARERQRASNDPIPSRPGSVPDRGVEHELLPLATPGNLGCTPHLSVEPNGTYSNATIIDIYNKATEHFTPTQQNQPAMCQGKLSFGTRPFNFTIHPFPPPSPSPSPPLRRQPSQPRGGRNEAISGRFNRVFPRPGETVSGGYRNYQRGKNQNDEIAPRQLSPVRRHELFYSWVVVHACAAPLPAPSLPCAVKVGLVELVSQEEGLLLFSSPANTFRPGVIVRNRNFTQSSSSYLLTHRAEGESELPFLTSAYSNASFLTPSPANSSLWLAAHVTESFDFQCSLTTGSGPSKLEFTGLNHSEFLFTKTVAVVTLDHSDEVLDVSIAVNYTYFIGIDINCTEGGVVNFTDFRVSNTTRFLSQNERLAVKEVLRGMGREEEGGWAKFWRGSLSENPFYLALPRRCTLDPQGGGDRCYHGYSKRPPSDVMSHTTD